MALRDGSKDVRTAGTAEPLMAASTAARTLIVTARPANTGVIAIGGPRASAVADRELGVVLARGQTVTLENVGDLSTVFIDATVSTDGVSFLYEV